MSNQEYYQGGGYPQPHAYPQSPQPSYGNPPQGHYGSPAPPPQGYYGSPPPQQGHHAPYGGPPPPGQYGGQPPMQYQQQQQHAPPPPHNKSSGGKAPRNCLIACLAGICFCCAVEECCECWCV
ncbi:hypothetical protein ACO1O0_000285 [Amphichorda felina]